MKEKVIKYFLTAFAVLLFGCATNAYSQHYVGVRAGYGSGTGRFYPKVETGSVWGLYSGGVSWKYYSPELFVGGVEVDAMYMQQGYKLIYRRSTDEGLSQVDSTYSRTINSVVVPIFWQPHAYMFGRRMRLFVNLGVTFSYNMSSTYEKVSNVHGTVEKGDYTMKLTRDNPMTFGLCGGGGVSWSWGRFEAFSEVRYYIGYGDILRNRNKYESNPIRSPLDGLQIQAGVYYRLGKGGILSPSSKKTTAKIADMEIKAQERRVNRGIKNLDKELKRTSEEGSAEDKNIENDPLPQQEQDEAGETVLHESTSEAGEEHAE